MNTAPYGYIFLPCRLGDHRFCRGSYARQLIVCIGEVEAARCICMCHQVGGKRKVPRGTKAGVAQ